MAILDRANPEDDTPPTDTPDRRVRWGIYTAAASAASFIVGFVMMWQLALASVLSVAAPLPTSVLAMFVAGVALMAASVAFFVSAATMVSRRDHRLP